MKKNNILVIQPWIRQGGAETLSVFLVYYLNQLGYESKILTLFTDFKNLTDKAKKIPYLKPNLFLEKLCQKNKIFRIIFGPLIIYYLLLKNIKNFKIINPHNQPSHWLAVWANFYHQRIIWTCNEPPQKTSWNQAKIIGYYDFFLGWILDSIIDKIIVKKIAKIIVLDEKNQLRIKKKYHRKAKIIYTGVDFDFFSQKPPKIIPLLKNRFILVTVGALVPQKNQQLAIEIVAGLVKEKYDFGLIIVGDGPQRIYLEQLVKKLKIDKYVVFTGKVSNEKLREIYYLANLNIFLAYEQSWGLTPLEALCTKTPSLVSYECGISTLIQKQKIGYVTKLRKNELKKILKKIYNNYKEAKLISNHGYGYVKNNISWFQYAKNFIRELNKP